MESGSSSLFLCRSSKSFRSSSSSGSYPDKRAALAMKYGGSSPNAVPAPHIIDSILTFCIMFHKLVAHAADCSSGQIILRTTRKQTENFRSVFRTQKSKIGTHWSGYGGSGKFKEPHSYAANVTEAICGPKYNRNVCSPVPRPTDESTPSPNQYRHHRPFLYSCLSI